MTVLIVEDNEVQRKVIEFNLSREGYTAIGAGTIINALSLMKQHKFDLVITDVMLPDGNGIDLLERLLSMNPELPVIVITAYGTIRMAVDAIKKGAYDYITKPFEKEELLLSIKQTMKDKSMVRNNAEHGIIGTSLAIKEIFNMINRIADSDVPVLITGESGTGKELVARAIHNISSRRNRAFVAINCAAIPSNLLESELFGYAKGAFTGAVKDKLGKFSLADKGTLFLDEVGSMDISLQPKLLRVIETGSVEMLGDVSSKKIDARIVSATNADLVDLVKNGAFREDLYYRLNVVHIRIPPLRERKEDIPLLAYHFIEIYSPTGKLTIGNEAMDRIVRDPWYGNVRELQNFIRRIVVIKGSGTITGHDVESNMSSSVSPHNHPPSGIDESMDEAEKRMIVSALDKSGHNMSKAAKILKIPRHKLIYRMKKYGLISPPGNRQ
jgi:two-component system NtrC family response regulator